MADAKITDLTDGGTVQTTDEFVVARSSANRKIAGGQIAGFVYDYVSQSTALTVTATTDATAQAFIDGNAVTYDGSTQIQIEFWIPGASISVGQDIVFVLYDGSTDLGRLGLIQNPASSGSNLVGPYYMAVFLTPSAASHTYHIKAWKTGGTAVANCGAGGAGVFFPAWYRITKA